MSATAAVLLAVGWLEIAPNPQITAAAPAADDQTIIHVLNRVAFGPRPGDIEKVRAMGVSAYIDQQLRPERLADNGMSAKLANLTTLNLSSSEIAEQYARPAIEARRAKQQNNQDPSPPGPENRAALDPAQQRASRVLVELGEQKILRAAYSERQLQEVLTDFWFNHFNADARKGPTRFMLTSYERDTIRPHVFGKFRDLLEAVAKSPAMLFYLDNWMSVDPNGPHKDAAALRRGPGGLGRRFMPGQRPQRPNMPKGLNENYGRELMELHTLGVDGGYTQKDVTEVARAFTGWTIDKPRQSGDFWFAPALHDEGQKTVLGHTLPAGRGIEDGEEVLDILARHPSTAHFIATKLVRRFVSDNPPAALVDRAAAKFLETDGDLREVTRVILTSPEFLSPTVQNVKVKTPFEFVVSSIRATGAAVQNATPLFRTLQQLGMPLYQCQPPTGYKDTADAWVNSGALVSRMNFALALANNSMPGIFVGSPDADDGAFGIADGLRLIPFRLSDSTRATIAKATNTPQQVALTLGSPEFQRR